MGNRPTFRYKPLKKVGGRFFVVESVDLLQPWASEDFVVDFERELAKNFTKIHGNVVIDGAEFRNCEVFEPNSAIQDYHYIKVALDNTPSDASEPTDQVTIEAKDIAAIRRLKSEVRISERYYHDVFLLLDTNFLIPSLLDDQENILRFLDKKLLVKHPKQLIIGAAGSGKTTLLRKLTHELLSSAEADDSSENILPLYFKLRDFNGSDARFDSLVSSQFELFSTNYLEIKRRKGKIVLLLDGLDELNEEGKNAFLQWMRRQFETKDPVRIIVTTRGGKEIEDAIFKAFERLYVRPLHSSQIQELTHRLLGSQTEADKFLALIKNNSDLMHLLSNPLSLSLCVGRYRYSGLLPTRLGALISEITNLFLETWDQKRSIKRDGAISSRNARHILGKLAYQLTVDGRFTFDRDYFGKVLAHTADDWQVEVALDELKDFTGLIVFDHNSWSFSHRYFQDFLCANFLIERSESVRHDFVLFQNKRHWLNVWNHTVELSNDPEFYVGLQNTATSSAFSNLSRLVTLLLTKDEFAIGKEVDFDKHLVDALRKMDDVVKRPSVKPKLTISLKKRATVDLTDLAKLLTQLFILDKSGKFDVRKIVAGNPNLRFFVFLRHLLSYDEVPEVDIDHEKVVFYEASRDKIK